MLKRHLLNIVLLAFVALLISLVVLEPGKEEKIPPLLTSLKASDITHIKLKRSHDKEAIELIKKEQGWVMLAPYQQAANKFRIDAILKLLSAVSFSKNDLSNLNPSEFGLDQPGTTITFNDSISIVFGHNKSLKNHRYVQIGSDLHMIADTFYYQLAANTESFIDHKLLPENINITQIRLPSLTLKKTNSTWQLTPTTASFSADAANQLIDEWQLSQAYDIKITKPSVTTKPDIEITTKDNKKIRFKLVATKDDFSLTNIDSGVSYILSNDRKDKLLKLSARDDGDSNIDNDSEK